MIYFLALLGVALGAVSLLVYRTTHQTLIAKKKAAADLIQARFDKSCEDEHERLDAALLEQAERLAGLVTIDGDRQAWDAMWFQLRWGSQLHPNLASLGTLSAVLAPNGYALAPGWVAQATDRPFKFDLQRLKLMELHIEEEDVHRVIDENIAQYFQLDHAWGSHLRSESLGPYSLPYDPLVPESNKKGLDWEAKTVALAPDLNVRRVLVRLTPTRFRRGPRGGPPPPRAGREKEGAGPKRGQRPPEPPPLPLGRLVIQCAMDAGKYDQALAALEAARDDELRQLDNELDASLATLRNHLLVVSLVTFGATVLGGVWLVRLGLFPLRKVSEAVSRVSIKDFRLPFEEKRVPLEVEPIVARLNETLEMLKRAFAREKQAAADISHELRTPLAALLANVEVTLRKPRSPEVYREALEECRASGQQMSHLVERLLALARLDAGVDMLRPQSVDAAELAEQCAALVRPLAEARGLELRVHRNGPAILKADPAKLREVVTNLLHNAIQYNRPHGSVDLSVARQNDSLEVEVKDTGIGINAEAKQHIFERFFRADPARSADGLHAGLGLAIVKGYVDLMGGTIAVESTEGKGSTFRVCLPDN
jgi:heavy metal sensor kinase